MSLRPLKSVRASPNQFEEPKTSSRTPQMDLQFEKPEMRSTSPKSLWGPPSWLEDPKMSRRTPNSGSLGPRSVSGGLWDLHAVSGGGRCPPGVPWVPPTPLSKAGDPAGGVQPPLCGIKQREPPKIPRGCRGERPEVTEGTLWGGGTGLGGLGGGTPGWGGSPAPPRGAEVGAAPTPAVT